MGGVEENMAGAVVATAGEASTVTRVGVLSASIPAVKVHDARASIKVQAVISRLHTLAVYHKNPKVLMVKPHGFLKNGVWGICGRLRRPQIPQFLLILSMAFDFEKTMD
jgi:hypothetical protein